MAGHSKWANIKRHKAVVDAKKGKIFTKLIREITVAARTGGGEPVSNPRLRKAIDDAYNENMTKDTIQRAIQRGVGSSEGSDVEELTYEGYGAAGVAVIVNCMTDNRNRTVSAVRHAFTKCGGNLGTDGSVAYLFKKQGVLSYAPGSSEDEIMAAALEAGAEDVIAEEDGSITVLTSVEQYSDVKAAMEAANVKPDHAEVTLLASIDVEIDDKEIAEKITRLIDMLEDLDDVQDVYSNAQIDEGLLD
ncbi:MAG: YebC/PmpR family DNA-binding transcriptional regulator [Gammaproteobacteria bacterium]|nr:YebC/PmpR family DNA-binding transcriptional regulator [Gammaproteobacteria bacterium]